jgi:predicted NBD/HSP70 family sugar kinase
MSMRKINTRTFRLATRSTAREVNRNIVLNLIREHQPISRAELARRMKVRRGSITGIVRDLLKSSDIIETGAAVSARGRRPVLLQVNTRGRLAITVDVRPGKTSIGIADFAGRSYAHDSFTTPSDPNELAKQLGAHINTLIETPLPEEVGGAKIYGIGVVVPGMVDRRNGRVLYAPRLGWRDVELRESLSAYVGYPVFVESAAIACALARLWSLSGDTPTVSNFAYVSVSDGVGVGIVVSGEVLRGEAHTAGEFGHVSLDPAGPLCACGKRGCWEAFACNSATSARYVAAVAGKGEAALASPKGARKAAMPTVEEIVRRARRGEEPAIAALAATGHEIGRGLAAVVGTINPKRIYLGGEITAAWDLIESSLRDALIAGTLTEAGHSTPVLPDLEPAVYRSLGAVALVAAPKYAAPRVG